MKRRTLLALTLVAFLVACRTTPTSTIVPTATPLPVTSSAHEAAVAFLDAWQRGDHPAMYDLCSLEARQTTPFDEFQRIYDEVAAEATIIAVRPRLRAVLQEGLTARAAFHLSVETGFVGAFEVENELPLVWERGHWAIDWSKQCIFRELKENNLVFLDSVSPVRANIYDIHGRGLAVQGKRVTVGVVPGQIKDEAAVLARLSLILNMSQIDIRAKYIDQPKNWFIPIGEISLEQSREQYQLLSQQPGISVREKAVRTYREPGVAGARLYRRRTGWPRRDRGVGRALFGGTTGRRAEHHHARGTDGDDPGAQAGDPRAQRAPHSRL